MIVQIIRLIHYFVILLVLSSIFIPYYKIKKIALAILLFMLFQFITNYGKCGLTELEYLFLGKKYESGFIYRTLKPFIKIPEDYLYKKLYVMHILLIVTLLFQLLCHEEYMTDF